MKVAALKWTDEKVKEYSPKKFSIEMLEKAKKENVEIICFPGLFGELFMNEKHFLRFFKEESKKYKEMYICSGSILAEEDGRTFHKSYLFKNGEIILEQKQLYLSTWEKERGLSRGENLNITRVGSKSFAILLPTDQFYPQVSRYVALKNVNIVLAPSAVLSAHTEALQRSGLWQNVQQNLFFAIESAYVGKMYKLEFSSKSIIHAPFQLTEEKDGILMKDKEEESLISGEVDLDELKEIQKKDKQLRHLDSSVYQNIFKKGSDRHV